MGRHTAPGTGAPKPDHGFWVRLAVAAALAVVAGGFLLATVGGGDDGVRTASRAPVTASGEPTTTGPGRSTSASPPAVTPSAAPTTRPPTLAFRVTYPAYITVRVPGGRTLVSRLFRKGATRSFDRPVLEVVNGRPEAVRFLVNGRPRKPGPSGRTETFVVRRAKG